MKTKLCISALLLLMSFVSINAISWEDRELKVRDMFEEIKQTEDIAKKNKIANAIQVEMIEILMEVDSFEYDFPLLKNVGSVISSDKMIHMYSYNIIIEDKIQYITLFQNKEFNTIHILAQGNAFLPAINAAIPENKWYGALYYDIHPVEFRDKKVYMLFGLIPSVTGETQHKVIDVMTISKRQIKLGASMFRLLGSRKNQYRVLFEFDKLAQMSIQYEKKKNRVVYNHLVPIREIEKNKYVYAPDESFDALVLKNDLWTEQENVKVKIKKEKVAKTPKAKKEKTDKKAKKDVIADDIVEETEETEETEE